MYSLYPKEANSPNDVRLYGHDHASEGRIYVLVRRTDTIEIKINTFTASQPDTRPKW